MSKIYFKDGGREFSEDTSDGYWEVGVCWNPYLHHGHDGKMIETWIFDNEEDARMKESFIRNDWNDPPINDGYEDILWCLPVSVNRSPTKDKEWDELELTLYNFRQILTNCNDLSRLMNKVTDLEQKLINLNHKVNQQK